MDATLKEDPANFAVRKAAQPGVPAWDSPPISELIDDRRTLVSCAAPEHQASYASHGLSLAGAHAFSTRHSEEQP